MNIHLKSVSFSTMCMHDSNRNNKQYVLSSPVSDSPVYLAFCDSALDVLCNCAIL